MTHQPRDQRNRSRYTLSRSSKQTTKLTAATLILPGLLLVALLGSCGSSASSGGGGAFSGGQPGVACDATEFSEGCAFVNSAISRMGCDAATVTWKLIEACVAGTICTETTIPGTFNQKTTSCNAVANVDTAGGADAMGSGDVVSGDSKGSPPTAHSRGAPRTLNVDDLVDELGSDVTAGDHETSQGKVHVELGNCDDCPVDSSHASLRCDESGYDWMACVNHKGVKCFWVTTPNTPFGSCGGYYTKPGPYSGSDSIVRRKCRDLDDWQIECFFPNVVDDQVTHCWETENLCLSPGVYTSPTIEYCEVMDNVINVHGGYWASYYRAGKHETKKYMNIVAPMPTCIELSGGGGGNSGGGAVAVQRQCKGFVECSGGSMAQCVADLTKIYNDSDAAMQTKLRELVASCSHLSGCEYVDCAKL